jgi:uracil-DNA glycosylase family 4
MNSKHETMKKVAAAVSKCKKCRLCEKAQNAVPGEGSFDAEIVLIGEAPGATEDETGRPFVGRAGKLLTDLLQKIGYEREDVWIGNVIKHRPPGNRDPLPDEIQACEKYLALQLNTIHPKLIVTLGRFAMNYFYPDGKISRDRGHLLKTKHYNVYPVYHPAAGLRNGNMMTALKEDFFRIPKVLEDLEAGVYNKGESPKDKIDSPVDGQLGLGL